MKRVLGQLPALLLCGLLALGVMSAIAVAKTGSSPSKGPGVRAQRCAHRTRASHPHRRAHCRRRGKRMLTHTGPTTKLPGAPTPGSPTATGVDATGSPLPAPAGGGAAETEAGMPAEPPSIPHVQVMAVEYSFTLSRATVPAGKVIFEFVNNGQDEHNLNIVGSKGEVASSFAKAPSKAVHDQTVEMHAGTYVMFCSLPEHEAKGMKATLVVQ